MRDRSLLDAVVVGAGQAGLAASYHLSKLSVEHVVLEKHTPGHTWRTQRWDSFRLNTPNSMTVLPGMPFKPDDPPGFETVSSLVSYFEAYIRANDLPVRTGIGVSKVAGADGRFKVECSGEAGSLTARNVVIATGNQNVPLRPAVASQLPGDIYTCHTSAYRNPAALPPGAVLIAGNGQSGCQVAEELLEAGRTVFIATGKVARARRFYRGRDTLEWLNMMGFFRQRPQDLQDPREQFAHNPSISGVNGGRTVGLQSLMRKGAHLCGHLEAFDGHVARFRGDLGENIRFGDTISAKILGSVDQFIEKSGAKAMPREEDAADVPSPELYGEAGPAELDLRSSGIGAVIWATGFTGDFSYLQIDGALDKSGAPAHQEGISPVPGLYYTGLNWLRNRGSGIVLGAGDDAAVIAAHIAKRTG